MYMEIDTAVVVISRALLVGRCIVQPRARLIIVNLTLEIIDVCLGICFDLSSCIPLKNVVGFVVHIIA